MRLVKWLGAGFVVLAAAGAGLFLYVKRAYPPERLRALAVAKIEPALGRKLRLAKIDLSLRGIEIEGLEVSEAPDFSAGTFFKA
ncbi:MAG: hypothetical protein HY553_22050, partial [Elusimicrobia bacterium]|nr:hypothetical protein [Elusimicrobiota bacterium]